MPKWDFDVDAGKPNITITNDFGFSLIGFYTPFKISEYLLTNGTPHYGMGQEKLVFQMVKYGQEF